jgi:hypothetical protein
MGETAYRSATKTANRCIRYTILAVLSVGIRQRNWGAVVNAIIAIVGTYLPEIVERRADVELSPWQRTYARVAMATHSVGMVGPYEDTWWWDHLTHTHSATILAGAVHVLSRRRGQDPRLRVLAAVGCAGVLWEIVEYTIHRTAARFGLEPILVPYGKRDTALDLCFNALGALLVVAFGDSLLGNLVPRRGQPTRDEQARHGSDD